MDKSSDSSPKNVSETVVKMVERSAKGDPGYRPVGRLAEACQQVKEKAAARRAGAND